MAYQTRELGVKITGDASSYSAATRKVTDDSTKANAGLKEFADGAKKASIVFATVAVGLTAYAKNATDYTVELVANSKMLSRQTGASVEDSSRLLYATQRLGISADQASQLFGIFSKKIAETSAASQPATTALGELGVNVKNADGTTRSFNDVLLDTADKFYGMTDGSKKTALAMELFGRSGKDLLPVLNKGKQGLIDLEQKADKLGLTLNASTIAAVSKYITAQKDLTDSTNALKVQVGSLTAPVLAKFDATLSDIVTSLTSTNNPLRGLVANVLAFGGPIAGFMSGLTGLASAIATVAEAAGGFSALFGSIAAFMAGPWGWALLALTGGVTVLTGMLTQSSAAADTVEYSTQKLTQAQSDLADALDASKTATDNLKNAQFDQEGANLRVETAQRNYNEAVKLYGPNSLEARQAMHDLKGAQDDAATAAKNTNDKLQDQTNKLNDVKNAEKAVNDAKQAVVVASKERADQVAVEAGKWQTLSQQIDAAYKARSNGEGAPGASIKNGNFTAPITLQLPHRASGGPVKAGTSYMVGEEGMEVFTPRKDGVITPNDKLQQANKTESAPQAVPAPTVFNPTFNFNIGMYAGMAVEKRQIALELYKELVRAARSQGVQLPMIGAVGVQ